MLNNYKQEKSNLLEIYKKLKKSDIFPVDYGKSSITIEDIDKKIEELNNEKFYVSITGQINSGKSTFINALIFEDDVLPMSITPHTAKITIIEYGKEPKIEITFYNEQEWELLKQNKEFIQFIEEDIKHSILEGGISEEDVIKKNLKTITDKIENLDKYVARRGIYTPFVKLVKVYYPSEILKDLIIVDTPGVNDPNPVRDRVAKDWVKKSNANIYVMYAGQPFSQADIEFLDKYMLSIGVEQNILVVNKIDSLEKEEEIKEWINTLLNNKDFSLRVKTSKENIVYISALSALIDKIFQKKGEVPEYLMEKGLMLEEKGYLEPEKYNLESVKKLIEKNLYQKKANFVIKSHKNFIKGILKTKIKNLEIEIDFLQRKIDDLSDNINLQAKKEELEDTKRYLKNRIDKIKNAYENKLLRDILNEINKKITNEKNRTIKNIDKYELEKINGIFFDIYNEFTDEFANSFLYEKIKELEEKLKDYVLEETNKIIEYAKNKNIISEMEKIKEDEIYLTDPKIFKDKIKISFKQKLGDRGEEISKKINEKGWFFGKSENEVKHEIKNLVTKAFEKVEEKIDVKLRDNFDSKLKNIIHPIIEKIKKEINEYLKELGIIIKQIESRELEKEKNIQKLQLKKRELVKINNLKERLIKWN